MAARATAIGTAQTAFDDQETIVNGIVTDMTTLKGWLDANDDSHADWDTKVGQMTTLEGNKATEDEKLTPLREALEGLQAAQKLDDAAVAGAAA